MSGPAGLRPNRVGAAPPRASASASAGTSAGRQPGEGEESPTGTRDATTSLRFRAWSLTLVLVAGWCIGALGIGVNFAHAFWEWVPIFVFGGGGPAASLWAAQRVLAPGGEASPAPGVAKGDRDGERELLRALADRGELTPITAALRTCLTTDESARMLEGLAGRGYLRLRVEDGVQAYAFRERDRPETPAPGAGVSGAESPGATKALPLEAPLSERELEVLTLLASGRTHSEIAPELYVAVGTVKAHVHSIYRKLGANRRSEALSRARALGLLR